MKKIVVALVVLMTGMGVFAQTGTIREVSGTVELKHAGARDFVPARVGSRVNQDTVISTGLRSGALIAVGSTVITVRPLTRLTLTEISASAGTETLNVNLQAGRVRVDTTPPAGTRASTTVISPAATASVRGTNFSFDGQTLSVRNGTVDFRGKRGNAVRVSAGSVTGVGRNGRAARAAYTGTNRQGESGTVADTSGSIVPPRPGGSGAGNIESAPSGYNNLSTHISYPEPR